MCKTKNGGIVITPGVDRADADVVREHLAHEPIGEDGSGNSKARTGNGQEERRTAAGLTNGFELFEYQCTPGQTRIVMEL